MRIFATGWSEGFDGPGRRLVYYARGCNMRCRWCANPEGLSAEPAMLFYPGRARGAARACPLDAVSAGDEAATIDRRVCAQCEKRDCMTVWKHPAFEWSGNDCTPHDIRDRAARSRAMFGRAGGITFGGGEATMQTDELIEAVDLLLGDDIDVTIESNASSDRFTRLVDRDVCLICDLKCIDVDRHRAWTGVDNDAVIGNLTHAAARSRRFMLRVPLVPGFNDDEEEAGRIAAFIGRASRSRREAFGEALRVDVLPLHHAGRPKYDALGLEYTMAGVAPPDEDRVRAFASKCERAGAEVRIAGRDTGRMQ